MGGRITRLKWQTDQEENIPPHPVFSTLELLDKILSHVTTVDLKNCRLVSKQWLHLSSRHLLRNNLLQIHFDYDETEKTYYVSPLPSPPKTEFPTETLHSNSNMELSKKKLFTKFQKCLHNSPFLQHVLQNAHFRFNGQLQCKSFQSFLHRFGPSLLSIHVTYIDGDIDSCFHCIMTNKVREFQSFFFKTPNLQHFKLSAQASNSYQEEEESSNPFSVVGRICLDDGSKSFIHKYYIPGILQLNALKTIQMDFSIRPLIFCKLLSELDTSIKQFKMLKDNYGGKVVDLDCEGGFEELTIKNVLDAKAETCACLSLVLRLSVNNLHTLTLQGSIGHLSRIVSDEEEEKWYRIPVLHKLTTLCLEAGNSNSMEENRSTGQEDKEFERTGIFPIGFDFRKQFPNLTTVILRNFKMDDELRFEIDFPGQIDGFWSDTVKNLMIESRLDVESGWMERLALVYPNVSRMQIRMVCGAKIGGFLMRDEAGIINKRVLQLLCRFWDFLTESSIFIRHF